ncbi:MAG: leucine--tRNA ligase [Candidatus Woesearchaeota archaeon]|nr:leucine--tRNA ligase [Candidatus Woesearchaeota archaeon]
MKTEEKWIKRWQEAKIFEAKPDNREKFFGNFPYPYVNSYLHLGHFYSSMRLEALSRYKRMNGFNVLYAQGWHCTGSPIVSAAKRIEEKEPKQWGILKMQGFSDEQIEKFADPEAWIDYFPKEAKKDFTDMGYSIDFRRSFITTSLNPSYDKFIRWQFAKLKEKNFVLKGHFPVVWDPKDNTPVGDHDRIEGEGETPQEYVLVKHRFAEKWIVSATLRPDTIMGVTNLYVNPESDLCEATVDGEAWIISEKTAFELSFQDKKVQIKQKIKGSELIGKKVKEFSGLEVPILPASFVNTNVGTGIVHSVPSDSADDLIALYDLQKDEATCKKYGLEMKEVLAIKPIAVLKIPGYNEIPAEDIIKKLGIKSQNDKDKLKEAKEMLYKDGFYKGTLNELYKKKFKKDYSGKKVEDEKESIKEEIIASEFGDRYFQLTGKVVARSLSECIIKIVDDQWFMAYGDKEWKKLAHECLDNMKLYPEKTRSQFNYVLDWLRNWACTREFGLGTRLPWDEKWLIESLSDSTIYMAYYTISHKLQKIDAELLDDNFFDYVFLGKGDLKKLKVDKKLAQEMREEFDYWYPMDFRTTGKDLIQNHMSFCIFNHTAIFPKEKWPKSFGLNGHVMVDGDKMSKSKGNFVTMRDAYRDYGADAARFTALSGGESIDDANFEREMAKNMPAKLEAMLAFAKQHHNKGRIEKLNIDRWMDSKINEIIVEVTKDYEETLFRSALQLAYFDLQNALKWYMRRCVNSPNKETITRFIEVQTLLLAPITPFICEEIWEALGKKEFIALARWPQAGEITKTNEEFVKSTLEDINSVIRLVNIKPQKVTLFIADDWKYELYSILKPMLEETRDFKAVIGKTMQNEKIKKHGQDAMKIIEKAMKSGVNIYDKEAESLALNESVDFLKNELGCEIEIIKAEESKEAKARNALPGKVAILVK